MSQAQGLAGRGRRGRALLEALGPWAGPAVLVLLFAALCAWSFRRWADPVIDFGAELYVPWRLTQGDLLYRDIAYRNGPLSPWLNALAFRLWGTSVTTLIACNLAILAGVTALTWRVFTRCFDRFTGTVAAAALLTVFGFSQYVGIANYNWVTPYQHSQTHGVALLLVVVAAVGRFWRAGSPLWLALAGAALGGIGLTKAELQVPALATLASALALTALRPPPRIGLALATFLAGLAAPLAVAAGVLFAQGGAPRVLEGLLGNWLYLGTPLDDVFYRRWAGLDEPLRNGLAGLRAAAVLLLAATLALGAGRLLGGIRRPALVSALAAAATFLGLLVASERPWFELARALPLVSLLSALACVVALLRVGPGPAARAEATDVVWARLGVLALWSIAAFALLAKMILNARVQHYGFALAMPATVLTAALAVGALPRLLADANAAGATRAVATAATTAGVALLLVWSHGFYAARTDPVGEGGDVLYLAPRRARVLSAALQRVGELATPDTTLLALPEGLGLNYWLRLRNPSRYFLFIPPEFAAVGGEAVVLDDVRREPPDFVALVDRPHAEFGVGPFGEDPRNGAALRAWIDANYEAIDRFGAEPFRSDGFGIALLRRKTP